MICFVDTYPADKAYTYDERIALLCARRIRQTEEKARQGGADEADYGTVVRNEFQFRPEPNHPNGSIYGYRAWTENYCRLLRGHISCALQPQLS